MPLIGPLNETVLKIEGHPAVALLDTGSQVSCIADSFYNAKLNHIPIKPIETLLHVEGASGTVLPYSGYIECEVVFPCKVLGSQKSLQCLFLIIPDTRYHKRCPVLIGTNIMSVCLSFQEDFIDESQLPTAWKVAFQCVTTSHTDFEGPWELRTMNSVTLLPNSNMVIHCTQNGKCSNSNLILAEGNAVPSLPGGLFVTPTFHISSQVTGDFPIHVVNCSTRTVVVPPRTLLAHAMPVTRVADKEQAPVVPSDEICSLFPLEDLEEEQRLRVQQCLERHKSAFSMGEWDLGHYTDEKHQIRLTSDVPFRERYRRVPPAMVDEVRKHLQGMLDAGIIQESKGPYSSAAVFVRKKDNTLRFCIDFRRLNELTVRDAHYLPRIDETFDRLAGSSWFSTLDLKSGYWQLDLDPKDRKYTAFTAGSLGFYEWVRLPMGLCNSAATFQRVVENVMGSANVESCLLYLDDIIVFSDNFDSHLQRLELVLTKLEEAGLKVKPSKCFLFQRRIKYLGHILSSEGIQTDPSKIEKVLDWPEPATPKQLQRFLGFAGYYRRFVKDYSKIAFPLQKLLNGKNSSKVKSAEKRARSTSDKVPFSWGEEQRNAFQILIQALTSAPVLAFADFQKPFTLQTDASLRGLGAVLSQEQEGRLRPIAYASRGLSPSERNYPAHKLEFLAVKWAVCDKFNEYLYGNTFQVITDNNPLTYVMTSAKLDATSLRWVAELSLYNFTIKYRPARLNQAADALSRMNEWEELDQQSIKTICQSMLVTDYVSCFSLSIESIHPNLEVPQGSTITKDDWMELQQTDPAIGTVMEALRKDGTFNSDLVEARQIWIQRKHLALRNGLLYRTRQVKGKVQHQLVLPAKKRPHALSMLHNQMGHLGRDRTLDLLRTRFYWPGMASDVESWISHCERCVKRKPPTQIANMEHLTSSRPMELLCMDFLCLEPSGGYGNILVVTDNFTKYAMAVATRQQTAKVTAKALWDLFINHYGFPDRLHSDQGANFTSQVIKHLCQSLNIKQTTTTPYHPQGNGQCERMNRTLLDMLGTLAEEKKQRWKDHLQTMVHAYNCTKHETTGYTPYELMFGRTPRLPLDVEFGIEDNPDGQTYHEYVEGLKEKLREAYDLAGAATEKANQRAKLRYDLKSRGATLEVGERVLRRKVNFQEGKHKLANKWEDQVFIVTRKLDHLPVYDVKPEEGRGKTRRLHRNLLLPIGSRLRPPEESEDSDSDTGIIQIDNSISPQGTASAAGPPPIPHEPQRNETEVTPDRTDNATRPSTVSPQATGATAPQPATQGTEAEEESSADHEVEHGKESVPLRRSTRIKRKPIRYQTGDFVTNFTNVASPDKMLLVNRLLDFLK